MRCGTGILCACQKSPPLSKSGPPQVPPGPRYVVGPRTTVVVQVRSTTLLLLLRISALSLRSWAAASMPFGRVGIGCDSLSSAALQIKSQETSLRGIFYYPPAPPKGDLMLLARSSPEVCCTPLTLRSAHIFRGLAEQRDCDFRSYVRSSHRRSSRRLAQRKILVSGLAIPSFARAFVFRLRGFRGAAGA